MYKYIIALLIVVVGISSFPKTSVSKDNSPETVTLSKSNLLVLGGEVNGESTSDIISKAKQLDDKLNSGKARLLGNKDPLYLFLNSPGGSIQSGLELIEALKGIGRPVNTVTLFAASMAFQLVQNLDDRLILKNGVLMSHQASGEFAGSFGGVHPNQIDNRYQLWSDRMKELDEQTVSRTNGKQTYESYIKEYDHEVWLTGTKSVDRGYADKIVLIKCDSSLSGVTTKHLDFMGLDITYDLDNCPLNTSPMNIKVSAPAGKELTTEMQADVKNRFLGQFDNKQKQVIPMAF